jgi:1-acyl-sn-glycerol-3-phosphate acyltransferase
MTVPAVVAGSALLGTTAGIWGPIAGALDVARSDLRFPRLRLLSFAWTWTTLEAIGSLSATALWMTGRAGDLETHYQLQRWWAARLVDSLGLLVGLRFEVDGLEQLAPGPVILCVRHVSLADALLPAWMLGQVGMRPRYVMKDDLLLDPSLDIVGHRIPNHFVDRVPDDVTDELAAIEALASGMGARDGAVIFPEGMVVTESRRAQAVDRLVERDPERAERLRDLRVLAPVRPAGTAALLRGAPTADVVIVTHVGLEALARVGAASAHVPLPEPVRITVRRVPRAQIPSADEFPEWLDEQWLAADVMLRRASAGATEVASGP